MGSLGELSFSAPAQVVSADGLLFDFDGMHSKVVLVKSDVSNICCRYYR